MNPTEKIEKLIKKFEVATTDKMDEWVCDDALEVIRTAKHAKSLEARPAIRRNIVRSKIVKIAVAAVIIIAVFAGIDYFGSSIDIATPTFADVIRPFLAARTATFTITTEWANDQLSFSMKGMFAEPDRMRVEIAGEGVEMVQISDMQKGKIIHLMPKEKTAMVIEMANMPIEKQRKANMFFDIRRQLQQAQDADNGDVEFLGERQIDGINTNGYLLKEELGTEMTVWIDAENLLPVRIENDMSEIFGKQMIMVMSDFEFNVELDDSLFSLQIPEGYTTRIMQMDASESLEKDLIEMFGVWADATGGKFPSTLSSTIEVLKEFSKAIPGDLFKQESQWRPENKEQLHLLLAEIKLDLTQLQAIIQNDETQKDLRLLGDGIKKHLKELREYKEQQEEAVLQYMDELTSKAENLTSDPFKHALETAEKMKPIARGLMFVQTLPADSDWHYAGKAVEYGDVNTPIFWYRPKGLGVCRIIYGDLSIADVDFSNQPSEPEVSHDATTENTKDSGQPPAANKFPRHLLIAGEEDFIEALKIWTDFMDGAFPASLDSIDIIMDFSDFQRERLSKDGRLSSGKQIAPIRRDMINIMNEIDKYIRKGLMFAYLLKANSDWHYISKGVNVGDSDKAIFWYKPKGSNTYRVIYADLTVEETTAEQLPVDSGKTQGYKDIHEEKVERAVQLSDPAAVEILKKVQEAYNVLETYRSVCEVIADYKVGLIFDVNNFPDLTTEQVEQLEQNDEFKKVFNRSYATNTSATISLAQRQRYYMQWTTKYIKGQGSNYSGDRTGCIWSDDNGYYGIINGKKKTYRNLYSGAGPWGCSATIPTVFYDRYDNTLEALQGIVKEEDDTVEGQLCYVIFGLRHNKVIRLWISKERLLILKRESEINFESQTPINNNWQNENIIKAMGEEVTPEAMELIQKRREDGFAKKTITKGLVIEIQRDIIVNEPIGKDELEPSESIMLKQ